MRVLRQSPTVLPWPYPTSSPSPRFNRMNAFVRQLGWRYAALSGAQKAGWKMAASDWPWLAYCAQDIYDPPFGGYIAGTGIQVYNNVNCGLLTQLLPATDIAPTYSTVADGDQVQIFYDGGWFLIWDGRSDFPTGCYTATISLALVNNYSGVGPPTAAFSYVETVYISYDTPVQIFSAAPVPPPPPTLPLNVLGVLISDCIGGPFFGAKLPLR